MGILSWIVVGLLAGWLAGRVNKEGRYGLVGDLVVGLIGGLWGGFISFYFFHAGAPFSGINIISILVALLGAVLLLFVLRLQAGKKIFRR
jgi:uncharacterized membrane protein YeaQ/YmgE (transglycosylase-associated protein family)